MIIATAGHVDHGKTLLVKALTGVDADRLPEEKARGMTIDIGFAYLPIASSETVGFIDVPGHERFVHNMLAGIAGIDFALLIIAADDGPMPQTREHLAILDLLDIKNGAVALTKIDRVAASRISEVQEEITSLLSPTLLADSPVFPVSAITGEGIEDLKTHLNGKARDWRPRNPAGNFRLAVDRCFSISGAGMIVTGTAVAGILSEGNPVRVLRSGLSLRARTIHAQNAASPTGQVGQRCAINLAGPGLKHQLVERGDWIVTGDVAEAVPRFDARVRVLTSELRPLAHWTPVHVHLGTDNVTGRIAILEGTSIPPGAEAFVQIVLDRPIGALCGDGLILRDQSAQRTIGGGKVVDIFPPMRGRARPARLAFLAGMNTADPVSAFSSLLHANPGGLNLTRFAMNRNLTAEESAQIFANVPTRSVATQSGVIGFSAQDWDRQKAAFAEALSSLHRRIPAAIPTEERTMTEARLSLPREAATALAAELTKDGFIVREASGIRLKTHIVQLSPEDSALWKRTEALLIKSELRPPPVHELADMLKLDPRKLESFMMRVARMSLLVRVAENRFILPQELRSLAQFTEAIGAANRGCVTAAALRDRAGIGRALAIDVLEYFDRIRFTRRVGNEHEVLRPAKEALGGS